MKIRAAVLNAIGNKGPYAQTKPLTIEEVELKPPGYGEVLIQIGAAGLCHSDLSVINGDRPRPMPMALGHEAAGIVEELGPGVSDLKKGDKVVLVFVPSCGHCAPCAEGRPALCEPGAAANTAGTLLNGDRRIFRGDGSIVNHHLGCSAFATHAVVSRNSVVKVHPDLPLDQAALFGCAVLTGMGAVVNTAGVKPGQTVAVIGLGGVGLASILGAVISGARIVAAVDLSEEKLALAKELGATHTFLASDPDIVNKFKEATKGGVDFAVEMAGSPRAFDTAYKITRRGGTTLTAGLPPPTATWAMPGVNLVAEERTIKGSYIGTCVPSRDIPRYVDLFMQGRLPVDKLKSGEMPLAQINEGFDLLHDGKVVRQVIIP
jgi:alcohol dehydrogenase